MCKLTIFVLCYLLGCAHSASTYDQRQSGDLNVQVDLKDLQIIALMKGGKEEYVDYDYAYDYSEMTIKPQNGTTPKPVNTTGPVTEIDQNNATVLAFEHTTLPTKDNNTSVFIDKVVTWYPAVNDSSTLPTTKVSETSTANPSGLSENVNNGTTTTSAAANNPICKKGFVLNQKGDCDIKLQGPGNALLKLVKLSQKLKLRRENRKGSSDSK